MEGLILPKKRPLRKNKTPPNWILFFTKTHIFFINFNKCEFTLNLFYWNFNFLPQNLWIIRRSKNTKLKTIQISTKLSIYNRLSIKQCYDWIFQIWWSKILVTTGIMEIHERNWQMYCKKHCYKCKTTFAHFLCELRCCASVEALIFKCPIIQSYYQMSNFV